MRTFPSILTALAACTILTAACATPPPISTVAPPRRQLPETATTPCSLPRVGPSPTLADLEAAYGARGAAIVACESARRLAVETHIGEHADEDAWLRELARPSRALKLGPLP